MDLKSKSVSIFFLIVNLSAIYRPLNNIFLNHVMEKIRKKYICKHQIKKGISGWFLTTKKPLNLVSEEEASGILTFDFKVNRKSEEPLIFTSVCGENCNVSLDMKEFFGKLSLGNWSTIGVPLKCLKQNGLNLQKITVPMGLLSSGEWEFDIGKVYLEGGEGGKHIYPCN